MVHHRMLPRPRRRSDDRAGIHCAGDFNTDLGETASDRRGTEIVAALTEAGVIRSRTDYLLGTDRSLSRNVAVRDPRHNSDHYMVVGHLRSKTAREHARYIKGRRKMPLQPPKDPTREDELFVDLRRAVPKSHERDKHRNAWINLGGKGDKVSDRLPPGD